ncbi:MAG: patatin-like phospholipase family protein [Gammaproteobacteria bacterium]|nr:MAG: patatin-like phospholipase family protein [Gammaproteobacteria bacterium]
MGKRVTLVLGGGAARGLAHIGVIRVLEEEGFEISAITGTSIGALVGGVYAAGKLDKYSEWVMSLTKKDVIRYLDVSFRATSGILKGDLIIETLRDLVGDVAIENLPIPFIAVATDLTARKEVWLAKGNLFEAIRASIAVPGVFTPQRIAGRWMVDGGLLNPVPVTPAAQTLSGVTIAVDVTGPPSANPLGGIASRNYEQPAQFRKKIDEFLESIQNHLGPESPHGDDRQTLFEVLINSFETMQETLSRYKLAANPPDLLISIPKNICAAHEFFRASELIEAGAWWTRRTLETAEI